MELEAMPFAALIVLAAGGWFVAAALLQYHGYAWADQTCESMSILCDSPYIVLIGSISVAAALFVSHMTKSS